VLAFLLLLHFNRLIHLASLLRHLAALVGHVLLVRVYVRLVFEERFWRLVYHSKELLQRYHSILVVVRQAQQLTQITLEKVNLQYCERTLDLQVGKYLVPVFVKEAEGFLLAPALLVNFLLQSFSQTLNFLDLLLLLLFPLFYKFLLHYFGRHRQLFNQLHHCLSYIRILYLVHQIFFRFTFCVFVQVCGVKLVDQHLYHL